MSYIKVTGGDNIQMHPTVTGCKYVDLTPSAQIWSTGGMLCKR